MHRALLAILVAAVGGCGIAPLPLDSGCTSASDCTALTAVDADQPPDEAATLASAGERSPLPFLPPVSAPPLPPRGFPSADSALSSLLDTLLIQLLDPTGPLLDEDLTFLERLCREGNNTDLFCRDRFKQSGGNTP